MHSGLPMALAGPTLDGSRIKVKALRAAGAEQEADSRRPLPPMAAVWAKRNLNFSNGSTKAPKGRSNFPSNFATKSNALSSRASRNAGAVYLIDDRWRRKIGGPPIG